MKMEYGVMKMVRNVVLNETGILSAIVNIHGIILTKKGEIYIT